MSDDSELRLALVLSLPDDFEPEEIDEETASLARSLSPLGTVVGTTTSARDPAGVKGIEVVIGVLMLTVTASRQLLENVVAAVEAWTERSSARSVVIEFAGDRLEITGASAADLDRLIKLFVDRHATTEP
ncbi:hypothetical protein ABZ897_61995 [Nonomuraea sp. NPDC046802]|uniref:hypothetical protein n=1 Tax=Nonomuraea sp. NPDC046802 TaxID=3154919 RepID=UPI0033D12AD4